ARAREVDKRPAAGRACIRDERSVHLEGKRFRGHRIGDHEPPRCDSLGAGDRDELIELVAGGRIAERAREYLAFAAAPVGYVAAARGRRGYEAPLRDRLSQQRLEQSAALAAEEPAQDRIGAERERHAR